MAFIELTEDSDIAQQVPDLAEPGGEFRESRHLVSGQRGREVRAQHLRIEGEQIRGGSHLGVSVSEQLLEYDEVGLELPRLCPPRRGRSRRQPGRADAVREREAVLDRDVVVERPARPDRHRQVERRAAEFGPGGLAVQLDEEVLGLVHARHVGQTVGHEQQT